MVGSGGRNILDVFTRIGWIELSDVVFYSV